MVIIFENKKITSLFMFAIMIIIFIIIAINSTPLTIDKPTSPSFPKLTNLWKKIWTDATDYTVGGIANYNSSVYITGSVLKPGTEYDTFVVKYDSDGIMQWNRTWNNTGTNSKELAHGICVDDSGIFVTGSYYSAPVGALPDIFIVKYNLSGDFIWAKIWNQPKMDNGYKITTDNLSLYVVGTTNSTIPDSWDIILLRYDKNGTYLWNRTWGTVQREDGVSIKYYDSGIYLACNRWDYHGIGRDILTIKYDVDGYQLWNKTYGDIYDDSVYSMDVDENGVYITGYKGVGDTFNKDIFIINYNQTGDLVWQRTWGGSDWDVGYSICIRDNYLYVAGTTKSYNDANGTLILKYDIAGNILWNKTRNNVSEISTAIISDNTGIYYSGSFDNENNNCTNIFIIKSNFDGGDGGSVPEFNKQYIPAIATAIVCVIIISNARRKRNMPNNDKRLPPHLEAI